MSALTQQARSLSQSEKLADLAVEALIDEAELSPKPALVDRRGNGAHSDLHLGLMQASALSLWPAFEAMAAAAEAHAEVGQSLREALGRLGREGEHAMLRTTAGVNTHRGAIWALGLLVASVALKPAERDAQAILARAGNLARIDDRFAPQTDSNGQRAVQRYAVGGARAQAQAGFPAVLGHGLPRLQASRAASNGEQNARLDALLAIMTVLDDTCVLHRAGREGLQAMQHGARRVLEAGGAGSLPGRRALRQFDRQLLALRASPGGAADLLAATLFIDRLVAASPEEFV